MYFAATNDVSSDLNANFINEKNIHLEKCLISFRFRGEDGCFENAYSSVLTSLVICGM